MNISYTPACRSDIEAVGSFLRALIDQYEDVTKIDYPQVMKWVARKLEAEIETYTRILCDGVLVGYYHFVRAENYMELDDLYLFPAYRGRGIGTRVVQDCLQRTSLPVMLYAFIRNTGAVRLYQRLGFTISEVVGGTRYIMTYHHNRDTHPTSVIP